jgi:rhodanese-related sulfurtransferase
LLVFAVVLVAFIATACGSDSATVTAPSVTDEGGIEVVGPEIAFGLRGDSDHVVLDVRTAEEFADGHLEDAINIDFYAADFAASIADLDRSDTYILYCRSGNRSGSTRQLMEELGFEHVHDVAGGIVAWEQAGLPIVGS